MTKLSETLELIKAVRFEGNCCILASLSIREVLRRLGFKAEVRSVALELTASAYESNVGLHTLGVGMGKLIGEPYIGKNWDGHLIVTVENYLIDPTFYNCRRKVWDWIDNVAVVPRCKDKQTLQVRHTRLPVLATIEEKIPDIENYQFKAVWAANSSNTGWRGSPDFRIPMRRQGFAEEILAEFAKHGIR